LYDRGRAYHFLKQYQAAAQDFTEVLQRDPNYLDASRERAVAFMNMPALNEASVDIDRYLGARPDDYAAQKIREQIEARKQATRQNDRNHADNLVGQPGRISVLIIGNSTYLHTGSLVNSKNDASDVAETLKRRGFYVKLGIELNKSEIEKAILQFRLISALPMSVCFFTQVMRYRWMAQTILSQLIRN
jgi:tetratricopeptide (TPR) repeat protein